MTKAKKNILIRAFAVVGTLCAVTSCSALALHLVADGAVELVDASKFETEGLPWSYEQTVSRPTGSLVLAGTKKEADVKVIFPDGTENVGRGDALKLDLEGEYTVEYSAQFGTETVVKTDVFVIEKDLFYVSSEASSAKYGEYVYAEHATEEYTSKRDSMVESTVSGVQVSLASGDVFRYSRVIDLSQLSREDDLFKIVVTPEKIGVRDVNNFTITLTDAYDPSNYLTIKNYSRSDTPMVYMAVAASNGQQLTGWQYGSTPKKHVNNSYGAPMRYSLTGPCAMTEQQDGTFKSHNDVKFGINTIADNDFALSIDYATKEVFNTLSTNYASASNYPSASKRVGLIADLDDPEDFEKLWGGFTTGECFLSIQGGEYIGETFNFVLTEINGVEGKLTNADEAKQKEIFTFTDRGTLDIDVAFGKYENVIPKAKVGVEYPIFKATARNQYYGILDATYQVKKGDTVVAENGEKFIPTEEATYTVVYTVKDYFKKTNTYSFNVVALKNTTAISYTLAGLDGVADTPETEDTAIAGKWVQLHQATALAGGCADGILDVYTKVTLDGEEYPVNEGKFFPTKAGEYIVEVIAEDYVGQQLVKTYTVQVEAGNAPVYLTKPNLPKYFISGRTYLLPEVTAYDYTDGSGKAIKAKLAYVDGEGTKYAVGGTIRPVANALKRTLDIVYYTDAINAQEGFVNNLVFKDLPIVEAIAEENGKAKVDYAKLFASYGAVAVTEKSETALKASEDGFVEFINPLGASGLTMRFKGVAGANRFETFTLLLTDSENANESVKLYYVPTSATLTHLYVNSLSAVRYNVTQAFEKEDVFTFEYDEANGVKFDKTSATYARIETYLDGRAFEGFSSGKVYISYGFKGVSGNSEVKLLQLAGQKITSSTNDKGDPLVSIAGEYMGYQDLNNEVRIPKAIFTDIVDPYVQGTVTVQTPENANGNRKVVKSLDGTYLKGVAPDRDYFIKVTQYGQYLVTYTAKDFSGNELTFSYYLNVVDTIAPEIVLPENATTTGKVGKTIALSKPIVTDNYDKEVKLTIYVYSPSMVMYQLPEGKFTFATNKAGKYKITYVAVDEAGNYGIKTVELTVTK